MLRNGEPFMETSALPPPKREDPSTPGTPQHHVIQYNHYPTADMFAYNPNNCHDSLVYVMPSDSQEVLNGETMTKNTGSRWREDETEALVEIWRDKICQTRWWKQSKGVRVNKEMWEEISQLLAEREVYRTASQCQIRMKNLLQFYRQAVDSRRSEKSWEDLPEYFDIVDRIMTRREGNTTNGDDVKPGSRGGAPPEIPEEEVGETNDVNVEIDNAAAAAVSTPDVKPINEVVEAASPSKKRAKFESETNLKGDEKRSKYSSPPASCRSLENGFTNPPRYSTSGVRPHVPVVSTVMPAAYYPRDQARWRQNSNMCCDTNGNSKRFCFGNEKDTVRHLPDYPISHNNNNNNNNYASSKPYIQHPNNQYAPNTPDTTPPTPGGGHVCAANEPCHVAGCAHARSTGKRTMYNGAAVEGAEGAISGSLQYVQELMTLQCKQMEKFVEIEEKRLAVEERRMREAEEQGQRNTAFIMEAVRILAENFRGKPSSSTTHAPTSPQGDGGSDASSPQTFPVDK